MSFLQRACLFLVCILPSLAHAQPVDTVGVSRDTTLISVPRPFEIDTTALPLDTIARTTPLPADTLIEPSAERARRDTLPWRERHSTSKASILSAVLPGAGQIYNRKYWKAPIVWAGLGITYSFIQNNSREYKRYRTAYLALVDDDPTTMDEFGGQHSPEQIRQVMETYQRWRDISYIVIGGIYVLNIIDASVDAHFVRFDVSPDLTLDVGPSIYASSLGAVGLSLRMQLR